MKSFKWKSRLISAILGIMTIASIITTTDITGYFPDEYKYLAPIITAIAFTLNQYSEEIRVRIAEILKEEEIYDNVTAPDSAETEQ